jgi:acyl-CoA synthetase (NDP forming)
MAITWRTLTDHGIPIPRFARVATLAEAEAFVGELGGARACLKADTNEHKAALGLVALDVAAGAPLERAWQELIANGERAGVAPPFLVQEMVPAGIEVFAGVKRDPTFGHLLVAGLGGRLVEAIRRSTLRLVPISADETGAMVSELGLEALGRREAVDAFAAVLGAVSGLVEEHPELDELDLNPIILGDDTATVVDLRALVDEAERAPAARPPAALNGRLDSRAAVARLISPRAVAVVGASADRSKPGGRAYGYLVEHAPAIRRYPVNPRGGELDGTPVLERIADLPDGVDAAVVATPAGSVAPVVRELGRRGVPTAVVFASGFKETGAAWLERDVAEAARESGVRLCGVNGMGVIGDAPLTFTQALTTTPLNGDVSLLTQSGAIGGSLLLGAWANGLGTARFVSVGNETDLSLPDYLEFLAGDDATSTIGLFIEGVADGRRLRSALHAARAAGKGVAALRTGASEVAAAAVRTHTGALAGSDDAYRQVLRETGAVQVADLPELLGVCQALAWQPQARRSGVGVLSTSGGGCSVVADHLASRGLEVPELEQDVQARLAQVLPAYAPTRNPIDTTGDIGSDPGMLGRIIEPVLASERVGSIVIALSALVGPAAQQVSESIVDVAQHATKPLVVGWMLPEATVGDQFRLLREHRIPVFDSIGLACAAVAALNGDHLRG